jgi:hypothetical protein
MEIRAIKRWSETPSHINFQEMWKKVCLDLISDTEQIVISRERDFEETILQLKETGIVSSSDLEKFKLLGKTTVIKKICESMAVFYLINKNNNVSFPLFHRLFDLSLDELIREKHKYNHEYFYNNFERLLDEKIIQQIFNFRDFLYDYEEGNLWEENIIKPEIDKI